MSDVLRIGDRPIHTDYVRIQNRKQFLTEVPMLHPDDPRYMLYWSKQIRRCVEGMWGKMFGGWRYLRGPTYYYANFTLMQQTNRQKITKYIQPNLDDTEWEFSYAMGVARGFSGFKEDDKYTCLQLIKEYEDAHLVEVLAPAKVKAEFPTAIKPNGTLKKYIDPYEYIRKLHDKPMGRALYENETQNLFYFGSRGGGKSYSVAGEVEHGLLFDGFNEYNDEFINQDSVAEYCIGSGNAEKSSELVSKVVFSLNAKASPDYGRRFGVWGDPEVKESRFTPCPLYRDFEGSSNSGNKKNPFKHKYKVDAGGRWIAKGTETKLYHVCYSKNKGDGAQAGSGGRYLISIVEEVGETDNVLEVHASNDSTVAREGIRFGTEVYIGTSGNLFLVQGAKEMFLNPQDYNVLSFPNHFGDEGKDGRIGLFLPFYMTLRQFKDEDGNTDFEAVVRHVEKIRAKKRKSSNPQVLKKEKMNRPCFIDEMFLSLEGDFMPTEELRAVERRLMRFNAYEQLMTPIKLTWDSNARNGVTYDVHHDAEPFVDFPLRKDQMKNPEGCVVMYHKPVYINGVIPPDLYSFVGHDPYVEEDIERGGSIGATYILMNPKYITQGIPGNVITASYIGKPVKGLSHYYENLEKLLALYGNPVQGLWFEKNRGADCRGHFIYKNKAHLLALTPQHVQGTNIYQRNVTSHGYIVSGVSKPQQAKLVADWLLEETELPHDGVKKNVERLPCLFLVRQMLAYNLKGNFDAFDGFRGCIIGLRDYQIRLGVQEEQYTQEQQRNSMLSTFLKDPRIFNVQKRRHARYK